MLTICSEAQDTYGVCLPAVGNLELQVSGKLDNFSKIAKYSRSDLIPNVLHCILQIGLRSIIVPLVHGSTKVDDVNRGLLFCHSDLDIR